jgi:hypothetical protein
VIPTRRPPSSGERSSHAEWGGGGEVGGQRPRGTDGMVLGASRRRVGSQNVRTLGILLTRSLQEGGETTPMQRGPSEGCGNECVDEVETSG